MYAEFFCPLCNDEYEHDILKESGDLLVQCKNCGNIHHVEKLKEPGEIEVKTIISFEKESKKGIIELAEDEMISIEDMLVAETGGEAVGVEVTSIEIDDKRVGSAYAADIDTIWTRSIDRVIIKVSYHDGRKTIPLYLEYEGDEDIIIGDIYQSGKYRYKVSHIKLRNGSMMRKDGWKAYARKIKRVYGVKS
ncbi:hypothetical protein L1994_04095 [Methanomicrobium antiquum]|uniref:Zn-finger protein n=1 Tax=Methanomicrobium antiquum TaxID=487686 RepID=A0AAF0FNK2_9EURY|nr:HVO_0476 family zinc finger protein [Methanomicrobium antiquum]MDD3977888.1 HVO_0476 family zinc finger protein [Methanomicrobium sp.]WFN37578.1 hypothetical protein L1994_04095 [Methanomicrobium antiquum]